MKNKKFASEMGKALAAMLIGGLGVTFFGTKLQLMPPQLLNLSFVNRWLLIVIFAIIITTLFSVAVGIFVAEYLKWRYGHIENIIAEN